MLEIPIYGIEKIDEDNILIGVHAMSVTGRPANNMSWVMLSEGSEPIKIDLASNTLKQNVTGVALIPDQKILREDPVSKELFYLTFTEEDIYTISKKFFQTGKTHNTTEEHLITLDKNFIVESWIITDAEKDKAVALGFSGLPKGTWMVTYHIPDKVYFETEILSGNKRGFSIESLFNINKNNPINKQINMNKKTETVEVALSKVNRKTSFFSKIANMFTKVDLSEITLEDGKVLTIDDATGDVLIDGVVPENGDYVSSDGVTIYTIVDGFLSGISYKDEAAPVAEEVAAEEVVVTEDAPVVTEDAPVAGDDIKAEVESLKAEIDNIKVELESMKKDQLNILESISMTKISLSKASINKVAESTDLKSRVKNYLEKNNK